MNHIFISYSSEDWTFARMLNDTLEAELKADQISVWLADSELRSGDIWSREIDSAINGALAMVVIMTPSSRESAYVTYEWSYALGAGVKVLPVLLKPTEFHPRLSEIQWEDFTNPRALPWDRLFKILRETAASHRPNTVRVSREASPALKVAVAALDSPNEELRYQGVHTLGEMNLPETHEALRQAVNHPVRSVRMLSAGYLARFGDIAALAPVIEAWRVLDMRYDDDKYPGKLLVPETIGEMLGKPALPMLVQYLGDTDWKVRRCVLKALRPIDDPECANQVIKLVDDPVHEVTESAIKTLGYLKDPVAVPCLLERVLQDGNSSREEYGALTAIGDDTAVAALVQILQTGIGHTSYWASQALRDIGTAAAAAGLVSTLQHSNQEIRSDAINYLSQMDQDGVIPGLILALGDNDEAIRQKAAYALGERGIDAAIAVEPLALMLMHDPFDSVRQDAAKSLGKIKHESAIPALIAALEEDRSDLVVSHDDCGYLKINSEDTDSCIFAVVDALQAIGGTNALAALMDAAEKAGPYGRYCAVGTLGKLKNPDAVATLTKVMTTDEHPQIRKTAAYELGELGYEAGISGLLTALERENDAQVAEAIAYTLQEKISTREARTAVRNWRLNHPQPTE
jgi:HEAT repeat protein